MVPIPQEPTKINPTVNASDRIVISGVAGLYPKSRNVKEFSEILYNKINPVLKQKDRWNYDHPEVAQYLGTLPDLTKFDAQFFKVTYRQGNLMDVMSRKILEQSYQAIYDAGVNPDTLSGKNIGVYVGTCFSETEKFCFYDSTMLTGLGIAGGSRAMFANRVSYWLNAKGPSMSIDEGCCSSTCALELAYQAMTRGDCEMAVVAASNLCLHPQTSILYGRVLNTCPDGKTKSFDTNADGCAISEAINVVFLQKAKDALRIYAEIVNVKCEFTDLCLDETGPIYGFYRSSEIMATFIKGFYDEVNVPPEAVEYVEAVGSAIPEVDKAELEAISEIFCNDRTDPLLVGSVMSNIGYTEAASGLTALTKVILGYETGIIAANLHCDSPRQDVAALRDGKIRLVTDHTEFGRSFTAINGLSITGVNTHVLLNGCYKPKVPSRYKSNIPYLITLSGRTETGVAKIINDLKSRPIDPEEVALLHNIHEAKISGHLGRGYVILDTDESSTTISLCEKMEYYDDTKRPLWFVYSGMGSQWSGMGKQLLRIPAFAAAIEKCKRILEPKGIDIIDVICSDDKKVFDNIQNSFVGIAAIQIGLTDVLKELGIKPDKIIGHSVGELGCAYADGCFTAEEIILAANCRGQASIETPFIHGAMAAVGLGYQQIVKLCPPEIEVACHNSSKSCTISGPAERIHDFVKVLVSNGVFAKEVPCSNIAYHSRYIAKAGPRLLELLKKVIISPKPRSKRWISSSVPINKWGEPLAKYSSAEYHTNNLLSPVLFEEASCLIPSNAVLIEIAPHGLLQAILKRSLPSCHHVPLTRREYPNAVQFFLQAIGGLFIYGFNPKIRALYPKIEFPVSTGTRPLSHLVEWVHQEKWALYLFASAQKQKASACKFVISTLDDDYRYLRGNIIRGKNLFPCAAALVMVWDTYAMTLKVEKKKQSVQFRNVHFHSQPLLHDQRQLRINITIQRTTGRFEVMEENIKVISGYITADKTNNRILEVNSKFHDSTQLCSKDIYQLLHTRGYNYTDNFRSLHSSNFSLTEAEIMWENNWVTFIDAMFQLNVLRCSHKMICRPEAFSKMTIDVDNHFNYISNADEPSILNANIFKAHESIKCGGVIIENIKYENLPPLNENSITLKTKKFVPHFPTSNSDELTASYVFLQIAAENSNKQFINVVEILRDETVESNFEAIRNISNNISGIRIEHSHVYRDKILEYEEKINSADLLLITDLSFDKKILAFCSSSSLPDRSNATAYIKCNSLLVNKELYIEGKPNRCPSMLYRSVNAHIINETRIELVIWKPKDSIGSSVYTVRSQSDLTYVSSLIPTIPLTQKIYLLASYPLVKGLKSNIKEWRNERKVYLTIVSQGAWDEKLLNEILFKDLVTNIYENDVWGGEYILPLEEKCTPKHNVMLKCARAGDFDSIHWIEAPQNDYSGINVDVHYAGINLVYVKEEVRMVNSYKTNGQRNLKVDFSGITKWGQRVMGIVPDQVISTQVKAQPELLWPVPNHWSLEDAATVPLAYCIAFYCLTIKTQLFSGQRVLIHGGVSAIGQALISIALHLQCEIFVTVSGLRKKQFLRKLFPQLQDDHIGNSRDHSFGDMIINATKDEGCDVIVSCVQGELKNTTLRCCATSGTTLDITQLLSCEDFNFGMYYLTKCRSYATINFSSIFENPEQLLKLQPLVSEGIARGYVRPLSRVTFTPQDAPRAFRLLVGRRHRGRVLLDLRHHNLNAVSRLRCASDTYQVILSKDEEFGIQLAERLASRGAQNINLYCEKISNTLLFKQRSWIEDGLNIEVSQGNINQANLVGLIKGNIKGAVQGLYLYDVISQNIEIAKSEEIILIVKKMLPKLKIFAIINSNFKINEEINVSTSQDLVEPLPVWIKLPALEELDKSENSYSSEELISSLTAVDVVEKALCSEQSVIIASKVTLTHVPLMQAISKMAGVNIVDNNSETDTLKDLGIDFPAFETIRAYLNCEHNISLTNQDMSSLTIKTLKNLEQNIMKINYTEDDILKSFFLNVDSDEIQASTDIVFLPTLTNTSSDCEFDENQAYMYVVPGVESHYERFRVMCERLKLPALVLQPVLNNPRESINDLAKRYAQVLLKKTGLRDKFFLLGYESGVLIAIKMAEILEAHGILGTVFCIGGSPDDVKSHFQKKLSIYKTEEALQNAILQHITKLIMKNTDERIDKNLETAVTWNEKVLACTRIMKETIKHSSQYVKQIIESAYAKVSQVLQYEPEAVKLRSNIVSLRPTTSTPTTLQKYSEQPVIEYSLNTPLAYMTQDLQCSVIINRHIGENILEQFNKRDLCEMYYVSSVSFLK